MGRRWLFLLLAVLVGSTPTAAEERVLSVVVRTPAGRPATQGSVELHRVGIRGRGGRSQGFSWLPIESAPPPAATATLDEQGNARFPDLSAGVWRVVVRSPGHAPAVREVRWVEGLPLPREEIALVPGASLTGRVRLTDGRPLVGVEVAVTRRGTSFGPSLAIHHRFTRSGGDGLYRVGGLAPGCYGVWTRRAGSGWIGGDRLLVPQVSRFDILLIDGARVIGCVTVGRTGRPVEGAVVKLIGDEFSPRRGALARTTTGADGRYVLRTFREFVNAGGMVVEKSGFSRVRLMHTDFWNLADGQELRRDFALEPGTFRKAESTPPVPARGKPDPGPTVTLSGVVRDDTGKPVALAAVCTPDAATLSGADGRFELETPPPPPGSALALRVQREGYGPETESMSHERPDKIGNIEIVLVRAPILRGRILSPHPRDPIRARVRVARHWCGKASQEYADWEVVRGADVRDDGTYELHLPTFRSVEHEGGGMGFYPQNAFVLCALADGHGPAFSKPFSVEKGKAEYRIDLLLPPAHRLSGRVVEDATGKPVGDAPIVLVPSGGQWNRPGWPPRYPPAPGGAIQTLSGPDGRWSLPDLGPGRFSARVALAGFDEEWGWTELPGERGIELRLRTFEPIGGVVVGPDDRPAAGVRVWLEDEDGKSVWGIDDDSGPLTDAAGTFLMPRVRAGRYRVHAHRQAEDATLAPSSIGPVAAGRTDLRLALTEGKTIEGRIRDHAGKPLVECWVIVRPVAGKQGPVASAETDAEGRFRLARIGPGPHTVLIEEAGVTLLGVEPGARIDHRIAGGLTITGRLQYSDGHPAHLDGLRAEPVEPRPSKEVSREHESWSDPDGRFAFRHLLPGCYRITGEERLWDGTRYEIRAGFEIEAGAKDVRVPVVLVEKPPPAPSHEYHGK